jgi:GxxExxY protein
MPDTNDAGQLLEGELTGIVIGAFYTTYNILGFGFLEAVYKNALAIELRDRGLFVQKETPVEVLYKQRRAGWYRVDLLVERRVSIEVKATRVLAPTDERQLFNYLCGTTQDVGLLLHYGPSPKFYRMVSPRVIETS